MSVDQGYWSLPCYPETSEYDSMQRSSRLSISFIAFKAPRLLLMHLMSFMLLLLTSFADWDFGRLGVVSDIFWSKDLSARFFWFLSILDQELSSFFTFSHSLVGNFLSFLFAFSHSEACHHIRFWVNYVKKFNIKKYRITLKFEHTSILA